MGVNPFKTWPWPSSQSQAFLPWNARPLSFYCFDLSAFRGKNTRLWELGHGQIWSVAQVASNYEKNGGQKSRWTVPLRSLLWSNNNKYWMEKTRWPSRGSLPGDTFSKNTWKKQLLLFWRSKRNQKALYSRPIWLISTNMNFLCLANGENYIFINSCFYNLCLIIL